MYRSSSLAAQLPNGPSHNLLWLCPQETCTTPSDPWPLTPAHQAKLKEHVLDVGIEDSDHKEVQAVALDTHPGQAGQQPEMQKHGARLASYVTTGRGQRHCDEEAHVEEEDGPEEVHVNVDNVVPLLSPREERECDISFPIVCVWDPHPKLQSNHTLSLPGYGFNQCFDNQCLTLSQYKPHMSVTCTPGFSSP